MKPIKSLFPISIWLMRIGLLLFAYTEYFKEFSKFHIDDLHFYVATLFLISVAIIFIAGFISKITLTVVSGLIITAISVFNIMDGLSGGIDSSLVINIIIASLAIYFISAPSGK